MKRLFSFAAFVLLALWLPATNHCALESAGVLGTLACEHEATPEEDCEHTCAADVCERIESASFSKNVKALHVLPPSASCVDLPLLLAPPEREPDRATASRGDPPAVRVLQHTWAFARRTALPARAPDLTA